MQSADLSDLGTPQDHVVFSDAEAYEKTFSHPNVRRSQFRNVRLKNTEFQDGDLTHNLFVDAYLNGVTFSGIDLTGSSFVSCDLRHARFERCKLWYVEFDKCHLDFEAIKESLPPEVNLRRNLLRSLRLNATAMGDADGARQLLDLELKAECDELYNIFTSSGKYFSENFNRGQRYAARAKWAMHKMQRFVWGYGLGVWTLLRTALVVMTLIAIVGTFFDARFVVASDEVRNLSLWEWVYVSATSFSTLGAAGYTPASVLSHVLLAFESLCGCVFLGLLAAATYRRIRP